MSTEQLGQLKAIISESGLKMGFIAKEIGISRPSLINRLSGAQEFKLSEVDRLRSLLNLSSDAVIHIFFS